MHSVALKCTKISCHICVFKLSWVETSCCAAHLWSSTQQMVMHKRGCLVEKNRAPALNSFLSWLIVLLRIELLSTFFHVQFLNWLLYFFIELKMVGLLWVESAYYTVYYRYCMKLYTYATYSDIIMIIAIGTFLTCNRSVSC